MADVAVDDGVHAAFRAVHYADARQVDLGPTRIWIASNVHDFAGFKYFVDTRRAQAPAPDDEFEVRLVDLGAPHELNLTALELLRDRTFRGDRFYGGFYLTHHYGERAWLFTRGSRYYVIGCKLEKTIWPYFVKHLLNAHALARKALHLKAACFALQGQATLLVARGSGGKTVALAQMCADGATFVSNTHVIATNEYVEGVRSTLRVRDDACFGPLIRQGKLQGHLAQGEYNLNPIQIFERSVPRARLRNLCIVDYKADAPEVLEPLSSGVAYDLVEQLGFPINTYGMKDDLLELHGGEVLEFAKGYSRMKQQLSDLVNHLSCFFVRADLMKPARRRAFKQLLEAGIEQSEGARL